MTMEGSGTSDITSLDMSQSASQPGSQCGGRSASETYVWVDSSAE